MTDQPTTAPAPARPHPLQAELGATEDETDKMMKRADAGLLRQAAEIAAHYHPAFHRSGHDLTAHLHNWAETLAEDAGIIQAAAEILENAIGEERDPTRPDSQWFRRSKPLSDNIERMAEVLTAELQQDKSGENPQ